VRVNLLPKPSWGRRYFFGGLLLVILWLIGFVAMVLWLYAVQEERISGVRSQLAHLAPVEKEVRKQVREREAFLAEHGPALAYVEAVDRLDQERLQWDEAISALEVSLPPSALIIDLQAKGDRLEGKGAFRTVNDVAFFTRMIEKSESITAFSVDSVEKSETDPSLEVKPKSAWIVRFHLTMDKPSQQEDLR
jgi:Tfp pilus assembly protein PilN